MSERINNVFGALRTCAIIIFFAAFMGAAIVHAHVLELEWRSPAWEQLEKDVEQKRNREAYERINDPKERESCTERDYERAGTWQSEHHA